MPRGYTEQKIDEIKICCDLGWQPVRHTYPNGIIKHGMIGPLCPLDKCGTELSVDESKKVASCVNPACKKEYPLAQSVWDMRSIATKRYEAKLREDFPVESIDLPPGRVSDKAEDKNYWVDARIGQHKGRKMAVIFIGDKSRRNEKTELFIDIDEEQIRFDLGDRHPSDIASKVVAEFNGSKTTISKK